MIKINCFQRYHMELAYVAIIHLSSFKIMLVSFKRLFNISRQDFIKRCSEFFFKLTDIFAGFIIFCFLILTPLSCDKIQDTPVPNVPVDFVINLNIVNELTVSGNSVFFPQFGYGGVIVCCELPGSYYAFDATCTHEISRSCIVQNEGMIAECPCCGSQFVLLGSAYPSKGPATLPLKQYHVSIVNSFEIRVYN
jgi:nitrite reductase/ring-hydroxylating ferredoxin subunit